MEAKLASVTANQEAMGNKQRDMDDKMNVMYVRQDDLSVDLKVVLELLKKNP